MRDYWGETILERADLGGGNYVSRPMRDIRITVFIAGTTNPAVIYAARTGSGQRTNPFTTGDDGYAEFWAEVGGYDIKIEDTIGPARIATKTVGWNAVNAEDDGIPPAKIADGITQSQLDAAVAAAMWQTGDIKARGGSGAPAGWLTCDGQAVARSTYAALYAALGGAASPWGQGDGSTTFNVPDFKGRVLAHVGAATGDASATTHALGTRFGEEKHTLTAGETGVPAHGHAHTITVVNAAAFNTGNDAPDHTHAYTAYSGSANRGNNNLDSGGPYAENVAFQNHVHSGVGAGSGGASARHTHSVPIHGHSISGGVTSHAGTAATSHNNLPPSAAVTYIIKT